MDNASALTSPRFEMLSQCGPEGRVILSECGPEMGDVFGPGDLCSQVARLTVLKFPVRRRVRTPFRRIGIGEGQVKYRKRRVFFHYTFILCSI